MKNRTNTLIFHRDMGKELAGLLKGKCEPGHVAYTFGTFQAAAKWLSTTAAKRELRKATEVVWRCGDGEFVRGGNYRVAYPLGYEALLADAADVLSSSAEKELDDAYLEDWKAIAR